MRLDPKILNESVRYFSLKQKKYILIKKIRKIIEIFAQLIISTTIFAGIFYAALPKYDHAEAENTLRNLFTIMFRVQQGTGKFQTEIRGGPNFDPVKYVKEVSHVEHMHADSLLNHPNFSSKLMIT